ncbi:sulfotransferase 1C2-like [Ciona intestinalis]
MDKSFFEGVRCLLPEGYNVDTQQFADFIIDAHIRHPQIKQYNDYYLFPGFEPSTADYVYNKWEPKSGDIVVCSYPKTGTTWLREIIHQILYSNEPDLLANMKHFWPVFSCLEIGPVSKFEVVDDLIMRRRVFMTHLSPACLNFDKFQRKGVKLIYIMRNPKDQIISWYHFAHQHHFIQNKVEPWDELCPEDIGKFIDICIEGNQGYFGKQGEGYLEHVRDWYKHKDDPNILFVMYEDLQQDFSKEVRKISDFLEVSLSNAEVDQIMKNTSIQSMKKDMPDEATDLTKSMVRKGNVGNWKEHFTTEQSQRCDEKVKRILGNTDIQFTYEL